MYFKDVVGQKTIKEKLISSVNRDKISHGQLISGLPGSGGLPLALAFARYLNCRNKGETDSCGECDDCKKMNKYIHPDLNFTFPVIPKKSGSPPISAEYLEPWRETILKHPYINYQEWMQQLNAENRQGNITVSEGREIIKKCHMQPFLGGYKIFLIWLPEFLRESGNVLLKVLEEPPGDAVFLLVTENPGMVLTTILSRTQQIFLPRLSDEDIKEGLKARLDVGDQEATQIAYLSDGNFNKALKNAKEGFENNHFEEFREWSRLCYSINPVPLMEKVEKMAASGRETQKNFLFYALQIIRESMLVNESNGQLNRLSGEEEEFAKKFSKVVNRNNLPEITEALEKAHYYIERNANAKIVMLNLSLQMHKLLKIS